MKKLLAVFSLFMAAAGFAEVNKMKMVTYFPVPYVAYSQVAAANQLDVGLTSTCNMNLGCADSSVSLKANTVKLKQGRLDLNGGLGVVGNTLALGQGANSAAGQIKFNNVRMNGTMQSLNAQNMYVSSLKLFGKDFPKCKGKGDSDGQMKWQGLTLQGASGEELYLMCGNPTDACKPDHNGEETYTDEYGIVLTWDYNDCEYKEQDTPPVGTKRCLTALKYCAWPKVDCGGHPMADEACDLRTEQGGFVQCSSVAARPIQMLIDRFHLGSAIQQGLESYHDIPAGCNVNGECNSCVVGQRYVYNQGGPTADENGYKMWVFGRGCQNGDAANSYGFTLQIQYAMCVEVQGDECPVERHKDCRTEQWTPGSPDPGLQPFNPNVNLME